MQALLYRVRTFYMYMWVFHLCQDDECTKRDACRHIAGFGPLVVHSDAPDIFTVSRLPISFGLLHDVFLAFSIDYVAVVVYRIKEPFYFD